MSLLSESYLKALGNITQLPLASGRSLPLLLIKQPDSLPQDIKNTIFEACLPFISAAFNETETTEDSRQDHYVHMFENDFLFLLLQVQGEQLQPIASSTLKNYTFFNLILPESSTNVLYLHSTVVDPKQQKQGIFTELIKYAVKLFGGRADYLCLRTQNPSVIKCLKSAFGDNMSPLPQKPSEEVQKIGSAMAEKLGMKQYVPEKMVGIHVYLTHVGQGVTKTEDPVALSIQEHLNSVEGGDAILFVMRL